MNTEIKIVVNEEKRTVVAIATGCAEDAFKEIYKADNSSHIMESIEPKVDVEYDDLFSVIPVMYIPEKLLISDTFVGVAKCHPEDEFSFEEGKKVAIKKMHKSYNKAKKNAVVAYRKKVLQFAENLATSIEKIDKKINK